jgi:hypothetical protein
MLMKFLAHKMRGIFRLAEELSAAKKDSASTNYLISLLFIVFS